MLSNGRVACSRRVGIQGVHADGRIAGNGIGIKAPWPTAVLWTPVVVE